MQKSCQTCRDFNAFAAVTHAARQQQLLGGLRDVWAAPTRGEAERRGVALAADALRPTLPAVAAWLDATLAETLGFYVLPEAEARRRLRTTNALEREDEEVRRRTRVIRIFPNEASYLRLVSALAIDRNDVWAKRRYVIPAAPIATLSPVKRARRHAALHVDAVRFGSASSYDGFDYRILRPGWGLLPRAGVQLRWHPGGG